MKVAVMGYGTVGSGVVEVIEHHSDIIPKRTGGKALEISHILDLRDFPNDAHKDLFTKDFNDILNILVQAKRTVLTDIQDKWPVIKRYCYNLNTAKYANMLFEAKPVAAGEKAFIVTLKYQPEVNNINLTENYYPLKNFLKEVLGSEYDFIAVLESKWPEMRNQFIQLNREKKLPKPQPIQLHHIAEYKEPVVELTDAQQYAIDMFGDIVEFEE